MTCLRCNSRTATVILHGSPLCAVCGLAEQTVLDRFEACGMGVCSHSGHEEQTS